MARKVGQIIARCDGRWLIRVYLGRMVRNQECERRLAGTTKVRYDGTSDLAVRHELAETLQSCLGV